VNIRKPQGALAALFLIGLLAIPLAGCSSKTANAGAAESVRQASQRSAEHDSVAFEMNVAMDGSSALALDVQSEGVYDFESRRMQLAMTVFGQEAEAVLDGSSLYLKMGFLSDKWIKQDLDDESVASAAQFAEDPTKVLAWLAAAGDSVSEVGSEEIRGEQATHYRAQLDLRQAASSLDADAREELESALEMLGTHTLPVDLWVNGDGLPVRVRYEMSFAGSEIEQLKDAKTTFSVDYFDWGKPVTVTVPDPSEVEDASGLLGSLLGD
jgi:hypothetical protein